MCRRCKAQSFASHRQNARVPRSSGKTNPSPPRPGALPIAWVLGAFAAVFVMLALSMFGFYELQLPSSWHTRLADASNRLGGGHWGAVALMGVLSAAIVSPCVAAPLAGALLYIGQTRDALLGGMALFSMAIGMGVPLVLVGVSEGVLLPRSGQWMHAVRQVF